MDERERIVTQIAAARGAIRMGYRHAIEGKVLRCASCGDEVQPQIEMFDEGWPTCHGATMPMVDAEPLASVEMEDS